MTETFIDIPLGTTAAQMQLMINSAAPQTVFVLQAGTYLLDQTVMIERSDVSLVGAGRGETILSVSADLGSDPAILVGHALHHPKIEAEVAMTAPAAVGDTSVEVAAGHDITPGDFIYVTQDNTDAFFDEIGDTKWKKDKDLRTLLVEVTEVDGTTIHFDSPLTFDYEPSISSVQTRTIIENTRLEGFSMVGPFGEADPGAFSNTQPGQGHTMIMMGGTSGAQVRNIGVEDGISHGITLAGSKDALVDDFYMDGTHNKGAGGNGYAVWIRDTYDSTFSNLHIIDVRHAVLFASYTSASGNDVHVSYTNRDVNFHGGRDQFNTVTVDVMVRDEIEQDYLGWATFYNQGESYGAPTDPSTNPIDFRTLVASNKGDEAYANPDGAQIWMENSSDLVVTAMGDDYVSGGSGNDTVMASDGNDTLNGGSGTDTAIFMRAATDFVLTRDDDDLYLTHAGGRTILRDFEDVVFSDGAADVDDLLDAAATELAPDTVPEPLPPLDDEPPVDGSGAEPGDLGDPGDGPVIDPDAGIDWTPMDTSGLPVVQGSEGWERVTVSMSILMGDALEAMQFTYVGAYDAVGNALANNMIANDSANRLEGLDGADRIFGKGGTDTILGGTGADYIDGGTGNDALAGGMGDDTLRGGSGNDTILAGAGTDEIDGDGDHDTILFSEDLTDYAISVDGSWFVVSGDAGTTRVMDVETYVFNGRIIDAQDLLEAHAVAVDGGGDTGDGDTGGGDTSGGDTGDGDTGGGDTGDGDTGGGDTGDGDTGGGDTGGGDSGDGDTGGGDTDGGGTGSSDTDEAQDLSSTSPVWQAASTDGLLVIDGSGSRYKSDMSFVMGAGMEDMRLRNGEALSAFGNDLDNSMRGNNDDNRLEGNAGDDHLRGRKGDDTLLGGHGNDTLRGDKGNDALSAGAGDDILKGGKGDDTFLGGTGQNKVDGGSDFDTLVLAGHRDSFDVSETSKGFLISNDAHSWDVRNVERFVFDDQTYLFDELQTGAAGRLTVDPLWIETTPEALPVIEGTAGEERHRSEDSFVLGADLDHGRLKSDGDADMFGNALGNKLRGNDGVNHIEGRAGDDTIDGRDGNDILLGGAGDDDLEGGRGNDVLHGGAGDDTLDGQKGADIFVFLSGDGQDVIKDLGDDGDRLWLGIDGLNSAGDLADYVTLSDRDTQFDFGDGDTLLIEGLEMDALMSFVDLIAV